MSEPSPLNTLLSKTAGCMDCMQLMQSARKWKKLQASARDEFANCKRLAILCGATSETYTPLLEVCAASRGVYLETWQSPYGTWEQQILNPGSDFHLFKPEAIFLHLTSTSLTRWPALGASIETAENAAEEEARDILRICESLRAQHNVPILAANFQLPPHDPLSNLSAQLPSSPSLHTQRVNLALARWAPSYVVLIDVAGMAARFGIQRWIDPTAWLHAKQPMSYEAMPIFTQTLAAVIVSLWLGSAKCILLDLDNTLWGGVVADDGVEGIRLGQGSAEGEAFLAFQRHLGELRKRGILLAVCSKNQEEIARAAFEKHDEMHLKLLDFSAFAANFLPKADNARAIAKTLNLGLDSFVFIDDNPVEREQMRLFAPEVRVLDLPEDPGQYVGALSSCFHFETQGITPEDLERAGAYAANQKRSEFSSQVTDIAQFLSSLQMRASLSPYTPANLGRVTQLINKSNQFNLCTRRYTQEEIEAISLSPSHISLSIRLVDRFGDNGLISAIHGEIRENVFHIENWVMSCRVLDRTVESVALNHLASEARTKGCSRIVGHYLPTVKNALVLDHYKKLKFALKESIPEGATQWQLELKDFTPLTSPIEV